MSKITADNILSYTTHLSPPIAAPSDRPLLENSCMWSENVWHRLSNCGHQSTWLVNLGTESGLLQPAVSTAQTALLLLPWLLVAIIEAATRALCSRRAFSFWLGGGGFTSVKGCQFCRGVMGRAGIGAREPVGATGTGWFWCSFRRPKGPPFSRRQ